MAHPDAVPDEATALGLGLFDCGVDPRDFANAHGRTRRPPTVIKGIHPISGGSPTSDAATQKLTYYAKLPRKNVLFGEVGLNFFRSFCRK